MISLHETVSWIGYSSQFLRIIFYDHYSIICYALRYFDGVFLFFYYFDYFDKSNYFALNTLQLDENLTVKVADFGLAYETAASSHEVGHVSRSTSMIQKVPQPVWWMAPECFDKRFYDEKTDVWSFAILMWEVMSGGDTPYRNYRWRNEQRYIVDLKRGLRPDQIRDCPTVLVQTMSLCWSIVKSERPKFKDLRIGFDQMLNR